MIYRRTFPNVDPFDAAPGALAHRAHGRVRRLSGLSQIRSNAGTPDKIKGFRSVATACACSTRSC